MTLDLVDLLNNHPELLLFILLALAYLIGKLKIGNLDLGTPPGMLIVGLIFGHFGFKLFEGVETIGLFVFLYAVAFQAGPAFFNIVLADGFNYAFLGAIATTVGFVLTYICLLIFQFEPGIAAGLMAGSLTTPAGLAAALDAVQKGVVSLDNGLSATDIINNINVSYAITYLVGDLSKIFLCRSLPKLFKFDLKAESRKAEIEQKIGGEETSEKTSAGLTLRVYEVKNPTLVGTTVAYLQETTKCSVLRYKRDDLLIDFKPETEILLGDRLATWGQIARQDLLDRLFGAEVADYELLAQKIGNREIIVTQETVVSKTLRELKLIERFACYVTKISRTGVELSVNPDLPLARGDVLSVSGTTSNLDKLSKQIGYTEQDVNTTDLFTFATGIVAGFMIGQISFEIGNFAISLGTAGGLLLMGIILGYLRSIHPTFGRVPPATLWIFKELGLLLFLAGVGVGGGHGAVRALTSLGPIILLCSLFIATVPVIVVYLYGHFLTKMNRALMLGAVTGAVTCTPAMAAISKDANSSIPTIGYAGTYVFATIFSALACSIMARF